jgi:hypothetical protein
VKDVGLCGIGSAAFASYVYADRAQVGEGCLLVSGPGECKRGGEQISTPYKNHMNPSKAVIAGAAVAGLLTGSFAARTYAASTSHSPGVSLQTMADPEKQPLPKHACKGQNDCKGQGGGKNWGKNDCKGKGGCATDGSKPHM